MIDRVVLGCALFGGLGSLHELEGGGITRPEASSLMDAAWAMGIRRFDTADAYGGGLSEEWIGAWRAATGHAVHVTTKTFNPVREGGDRGLAPARVRRQVAASLGRLGVDAIDLYLAHEWDPDVPAAEVRGVLEDLVAEGLIRGFGYSNVTAEQLRAVVALARPEVVQNSYSLLLRIDDADVIPTCVARGIAYEGYSPLAGGWLTGKYGAGEPLPSGSRMALAPQWYTHIEPEAASRAVGELARFAAERGISAAALAVAWALQSPGVARVIVGPKRLEHLDHVAEACATPLDASEVAAITAVFTPRAVPR